MTKLLVPTIDVQGQISKHDMPCAVYTKKSAMLELGQGIFYPSLEAQADGWHLVKSNTKFQSWLIATFFT